MVDQAYSLRELMREKKIAAMERSAVMIAVASGKGGVGKSLLTLNLAIALHQRGQKVLVIDADFGLSNIDIMLGISTRRNLSDVIRGTTSIQEAIMPCRSGILVISGGSGVDELVHLDEEALDSLMRAFLTIQGQVDVILFDMGAGISDRLIQVISACSKALVVTTPEPTSILDAYALVKSVCAHRSPPSFHIVVNRAASLKEGRHTMENFVDVVRRYIGAEAHPLGIIPYDDAAVNAVKAQTPLLEASPKAAAAMAIGRIADQLVGKAVSEKQAGGIAGFFLRLLQNSKHPRHMEG